MLFRSCCVGLKHYKTHIFAGLIIFAATTAIIVDVAEIMPEDSEG